MGIEKKVKWAERRDRKKDPLEFFRENYDISITRGQLNRADNALYRIILRRGLLDTAIPKKESRFGNDVFGYYTAHYSGKTRGEVAMLDFSLYEKLKREGLLEKVPLKQRNKTLDL